MLPRSDARIWTKSQKTAGSYGGAPLTEVANFADILGIVRERFMHVFLLRPMFQIAGFNFFCKSACVEDK